MGGLKGGNAKTNGARIAKRVNIHKKQSGATRKYNEWGADRKRNKCTQNDRALRGNTSTQYTVGIQGWVLARGDRSIFEGTSRTGGVGEGIARRGAGTRRGRGRRCGGSEEDVGDAAEHADVEAGAPSAIVVGEVDLRYGADGVLIGRGSGESPEEGTIQGRWGGRAGVAGAWFGTDRGREGKWGGGLLQAGRQATVRRDV